MSCMCLPRGPMRRRTTWNSASSSIPTSMRWKWDKPFPLCSGRGAGGADCGVEAFSTPLPPPSCLGVFAAGAVDATAQSLVRALAFFFFASTLVHFCDAASSEGDRTTPSLSLVETSEMASASSSCWPRCLQASPGTWSGCLLALAELGSHSFALLSSGTGSGLQPSLKPSLLSACGAEGATLAISHGVLRSVSAKTSGAERCFLGAIAWHSSCVALSQPAGPRLSCPRDCRGGHVADLVHDAGNEDGRSKLMKVFFTGTCQLQATIALPGAIVSAEDIVPGKKTRSH
mmetsp:Transcript_31310/g.86057  ORF Transcript_31310/g.86057 Transcript_31310/m.86057 type:complete len:288 (+) Transcript_31310:471-1334(+)|eukprot:CAMPEP_0117493246 /NCGR_PEP_ID=MMETSP0784-20121206/18999_1 /TAXON_ID=39447 /ORGANISM="" /LENGTH=287 /DNA_ID=CAMNT_0005288093 /DNA_START=453 /DNA_END=1316 /DNA_ORIENTATION=+